MSSKKTLKFTDIAKGILRIRLSENHAGTLAERYGILTLPENFADSGIETGDNCVTLPNGRVLNFNIIEGNSSEYNSLHESLCEEFKSNYTDFQAIIGAPELNSAPTPIPEDVLPPEDCYAISFSINESENFYGLGEAIRDRIELRGRAYQNWARYQYNEIPIPVVVSNEGWGIFINARARSFVDIGKRASDKLTVLGEDDELDIFILCGSTITEMLDKYTFLTGKIMLLPKWAYGLTYIAPIWANQFEVMAQAERMRREHIPCDMISLEPGWMTEFYDYSTKKEWELKRFHIMSYMREGSSVSEVTFIKALKRFGFKLSLWLCIRYDLTEEAERQVVNGDPDNYGEAWYDHLKKFVDQSVDGFKLDPADMLCCFDRMSRPRCYNGLTPMQMHNYNQILLPKQMYDGFKNQKGIRPMHHYSGGYSGIQKWSASTTGDNGGVLGAMIWLETLALSGHMNTTVDMNIHYPESIHFGMFVPWAHLNTWAGVEQPWYAGEKLHLMFVEYARLRYRLLPYIYSAAIEGHENTVPMVRPMPIAFPDFKEAAKEYRQYCLGENLLITAYTDRVMLPEGRWTDAWTGEEYEGPVTLENYHAPETRGGGLFIRGGAIIPNWSDRDYIGQMSDEEIYIDIYPDGNSSYIFREDDGISLDYETKMSCHTQIDVSETADSINVVIGKREGDYDGKVECRTWRIRVHTKSADDKRTINVKCDSTDKFVIEENVNGLWTVDATDALKVF